MWRDFPERLAERTGRRVVTYSRYGHGASDVLREARAIDYMHHEGEVVLPALLEALALRRPILFGHSDGASIALIYAGAYPERVTALVLEAPHVFVEELALASIARAKAAFQTTDLAARLGRYHADAERTFRGWNDVWLDRRFRAWDITPYVERVRAPTLVIQGSDDEYGTEAQLAAIAARVPVCETLVIERCGHSPHRTAATAVLERTAAFLASMNGS